jgi:hypothetical protein
MEMPYSASECAVLCCAVLCCAVLCRTVSRVLSHGVVRCVVLCLPISCYQDDHSLSDSLGDAGGTARAQAAMCAQGVQQPYLRCTVACNGVPRCAVLLL